MKVRECCKLCLKGLVEKTVQLCAGNEQQRAVTLEMLDLLWSRGGTPPAISNRLLKFIRQKTGVYDPYAAIKEEEFRGAAEALPQMEKAFPRSLDGALKVSAMGNSVDFFVKAQYTLRDFIFTAPMDKIESEIYNKGKNVLILGDNVGDFIFDRPLISFLQEMGKKVYYGVKEHPVQNDLSMVDVERFGFKGLYRNIISTGTCEVGIRKEEMQGLVREFWEGDAIVFAKGMGNYETISEFNEGRPVIHIMKVKCQAVAEATGKEMGTYIVIIGGGKDGR